MDVPVQGQPAHQSRKSNQPRRKSSQGQVSILKSRPSPESQHRRETQMGKHTAQPRTPQTLSRASLNDPVSIFRHAYPSGQRVSRHGHPAPPCHLSPARAEPDVVPCARAGLAMQGQVFRHPRSCVVRGHASGGIHRWREWRNGRRGSEGSDDLLTYLSQGLFAVMEGAVDGIEMGDWEWGVENFGLRVRFPWLDLSRAEGRVEQ
jgi:hypothetical protein